MNWPLTAGRSPRLLTGMRPCQVRLGGRPRRAERGELVVPERIDLLSERYGTRLALLSAQTYPARVRRAAAGGDPTWAGSKEPTRRL